MVSNHYCKLFLLKINLFLSKIDDFGTEEANVICRQLGFDGESTVVKGTFGQGKGPIWLDQVKCLGNETTIDDCVHWQWGEHNCAHTEDVGVKCHDGKLNILLIFIIK